MKTPTTLLLAATLTASFSSCASIDMIARAEGKIPPSQANDPNVLVPSPNPAYYALVPLTIPFDVLTFPIQYVYFREKERAAY